MSIEVLEEKQVITRKPHNCWGCMRLFPKDTNMLQITNVDAGIIHSYWCKDCVEFMNGLEEWQVEDGFEYGRLLNYDEYCIKIKGVEVNE